MTIAIKSVPTLAFLTTAELAALLASTRPAKGARTGTAGGK